MPFESNDIRNKENDEEEDQYVKKSLKDLKSMFESRNTDNKVKVDKCYGCEETIYSTEQKVNIGRYYHISCLKCFSCGVHLSLSTVKRDPTKPDDYSVYCNNHVPRSHTDMTKAELKNDIKNGQTLEQISHKKLRFGEGRWNFDPDKIVNFRQLQNLRSTQEFKKRGILAAQAKLEQMHREEEDALYKDFEEYRRELMRQLQKEIRDMKEASVRDLIGRFNRIGKDDQSSSVQGSGAADAKTVIDQQKEENRLREYYDSLLREKMISLQEQLSLEQKSQVTNMVEKQSREMLGLLMTKDETAEDNIETLNEVTTPAVEILPDVLPPKKLKQEIIGYGVSCTDHFEKLDKKVIQVAKHDVSTTFTDLVRNLTEECEDDYERVRAIFRWITLKDLSSMKFDMDENDNEKDSPLNLLRGIKKGTESYHDLFKRLCSYAGIACVIINGISKGVGYRPGMSLKNTTKFRNAWTAVYLQESWHLINCNWGARHWKSGMVSTETDETSTSSELKYRYDDFYFLTDPKEHIYEHFPDDEKWQLLETPLTFKEFENLPQVKSAFFNSGLSWSAERNEPDGTLKATSGKLMDIEIVKNRQTIAEPEDITYSVFGAILEPVDQDEKASKHTQEKLNQCCCIRMTANQKVIISVNIPQALPNSNPKEESESSPYYLNIFVNDDKLSKSLDLACAFKLVEDSNNQNINENDDAQLINRTMPSTLPELFPKVSFFGPNRSFFKFGLEYKNISISDPLFILPFSKDESSLGKRIHLKINREIGKNLKLSYSWKKFNCEKNQLIPYEQLGMIIWRSDDLVVFEVQSDGPGYYVFTIYAADANSSSLESIYKALAFQPEGTDENTSFRKYPLCGSRWRESILYQPICASLNSTTHSPLKCCVRLKEAEEVALVISGSEKGDMDDLWYYLEKVDSLKDLETSEVNFAAQNEQMRNQIATISDQALATFDECDVWRTAEAEGQIDLNNFPKATKCRLYAKYESRSDSFKPLLEYTIN